jgi:molybdenum cofactor biosynthesis protein MoaC
MSSFSHLDENGNIKMVDVTDKLTTVRTAIATGYIKLSPRTIKMLKDKSIPKGDVLTTAKIAGIQSAKRTADLIPLCHPLNITFADITFKILDNQINIQSIVKAKDTTGIEMEALTAVSTTALTIYDMCKAVDNTMEIGSIKLINKQGGKSSHKTDYRPSVGIIVLSDSISAGSGIDKSGEILKTGFAAEGCKITNFEIIPDEPAKLINTIDNFVGNNVELIITSGGTGIGPRDVTVETLSSKFTARLDGVEQALHAFGLGKIKTSMLSRLKVGMINNSIVVCLPGSTGAAKDALSVLIPTIFHAYHMKQGEKH